MATLEEYERLSPILFYYLPQQRKISFFTLAARTPCAQRKFFLRKTLGEVYHHPLPRPKGNIPTFAGEIDSSFYSSRIFFSFPPPLLESGSILMIRLRSDVPTVVYTYLLLTPPCQMRRLKKNVLLSPWSVHIIKLVNWRYYLSKYMYIVTCPGYTIIHTLPSNKTWEKSPPSQFLRRKTE